VAWNIQSILELSSIKSKGSLLKIAGNYVSIITIQSPGALKTKSILLYLRNVSGPTVSVQVINASVVYGVEHLLRTLAVTLECRKRHTFFIRDQEIDVLLRLSYTRQVSDAIDFAGFPKSGNACLLLYSESKSRLLVAKRHIPTLCAVGDNTSLEPNETKKTSISAKLGIDHTLFDDTTFVKYLAERAALLVR
jgi:tRNA threonylcarbamoyladenosine modification (KEOPS) complex Cgi121 subunit